MKIIVTGMQLAFSSVMIDAANASMKIFGHYERTKVVTVVFVMPIILNVLQVISSNSSSWFKTNS